MIGEASLGISLLWTVDCRGPAVPLRAAMLTEREVRRIGWAGGTGDSHHPAACEVVVSGTADWQQQHNLGSESDGRDTPLWQGGTGHSHAVTVSHCSGSNRDRAIHHTGLAPRVVCPVVTLARGGAVFIHVWSSWLTCHMVADGCLCVCVG